MADILVAEDQSTIRDILQQILVGDGHAVDLASDGAEGLDRVFARGHPYDLIYSNYCMPRMDGVTFLNAIRPLVAFRVPRILASGYDLTTLAPLGIETGACDVLPYPFLIEDVRQIVAWALRVRTAYAHLRRSVSNEVAFLHRLAATTGSRTALFAGTSSATALARDDAAARSVRGAPNPPLSGSFDALLRSPLARVRVRAARAVGRAPGGVLRALRVLRRAMDDRDPSVAHEAAQAVQELLAATH